MRVTLTTGQKRVKIMLGAPGSPEVEAKHQKACAILEANDGRFPPERLLEFRQRKKVDPKPSAPRTEEEGEADDLHLPSLPIEETTEPLPPPSQEAPLAPEKKPDVKTITIYNRTFKLPYHDLFRPLTEAERS